MFGERRKTGGMNLNGRMSNVITPTKRFTDFGMTSVRKTDARPSLNIAPRPSMFGAKGPTPAPREVKSLQQINIQKIYNFLVESDGDDAPSEQVIRSPRGQKDFIMIFEMIYQHFSKDYEFPVQSRLEDEVIPIFKALGYPFSLKNSHFNPIGTGHGWPHLLDALGWLVDLVKVNQCVNTQEVIFGDFLEQAKVQEKSLGYSWHANMFRDYTHDKKVIENPENPIWEEKKTQLRGFFETNNDYEDMATNLKSTLEQLKFDCDEIEAERGQEQHLLDEISKMKDDIRKAEDYLEQTKNVKMLKEEELDKTKDVLEGKQGECEKIQTAVNELKERIEQQKTNHGLSGKEVRMMNLENSKDKETVSEIQGELDKLSKEMWTLGNDDCFKEQKSKFIQLIDHIKKLLNGLDVQLSLNDLKPPANEFQLKSCWETLSQVWMPEINRQLHQRKLELDTETSRFADKFAAAEERIQIESEMLCESKKREAREERLRRNERDEWKNSRQEMEKRYDELENESEVLKQQMQMDGSLDKEIDSEKEKMAKKENELRAQQTELETALRLKLDQIVAEIAEIENEKMMIHREFNELETIVYDKCGNY